MRSMFSELQVTGGSQTSLHNPYKLTHHTGQLRSLPSPHLIQAGRALLFWEGWGRQTLLPPRRQRRPLSREERQEVKERSPHPWNTLSPELVPSPFLHSSPL